MAYFVTRLFGQRSVRLRLRSEALSGPELDRLGSIISTFKIKTPNTPSKCSISNIQMTTNDSPVPDLSRMQRDWGTASLNTIAQTLPSVFPNRSILNYVHKCQLKIRECGCDTGDLPRWRVPAVSASHHGIPRHNNPCVPPPLYKFQD